MDEIEANILAAWRRVRETLANDQHELARRLARRRRPTLMRPPRAWCLALRASDHRLPGCRPQASPCHLATLSPCQHEQIPLPAALLKQLCSPIRLRDRNWSLAQLAKKVGRLPGGLLTVRLTGKLRSDYYPPTGYRGKPKPLLNSDDLLDPGAKLFAGPDPVWSWTADWVMARIPDDFEQTLTRVPVYAATVPRHLYAEHRHPELDAAPPLRPSRRLPPPPPDAVWYKWKGDQFIGYDWRRAETNPQIRINYERHERSKAKARETAKRRRREHPPPSKSQGSIQFKGYTWLCPVCEKTCRTIYLPLPTINLLRDIPRLAQIIDIPPLLPLPLRERAGVRGKREEPDDVPLGEKRDGHVLTFACKRCHRVKFFSRLQNEAWNDVIAYMTQGLLYGREVPRPAWFTKDRKRPYKPLINARPALRREQVLDRLLQGQTRAQIAAELRMTDNAVNQQIHKIFKHHGVRTHRALLRKHARPLPPHLQLSADRVLRHLRAGLSQAEIAHTTGITKSAVQRYIWQLRKSGQLARPHRKRDAVARLLLERLTPKQIAQRLGLSMQNVYDHTCELRRQQRLPAAT